MAEDEHKTQQTILLVEDDHDVRASIVQSLDKAGFRVETVDDGSAVLSAVQTMQPDLILLDLGLPTVDGLDILKDLRRTEQIPIICVTARKDEADKVVGLELGADDYVSKPFSPRELVARVRAVLRRSESPALEKTKMEFNDLVINCDERKVFVENKKVNLTAREFDLLSYLASSPNRVYTRGQILENVWQSSAEWQETATVTELIRRIRCKIEVDNNEPRWIKTVRGIGYRFESQ